MEVSDGMKAFIKSYGNYKSYPYLVNDAFVEEHGRFRLRELAQSLEKRPEYLIYDQWSDVETDVVAWDISADGVVKTSSCKSNAEIYELLGDQSHPNPQYEAMHKANASVDELYSFLHDQSRPYPQYEPMILGKLATRADPKLRLIFLRCSDIPNFVQISLEGLRRMFSYHEVSPNILDFLAAYNTRHESGFHGFRTEVHLTKKDASSAIPELHRSGLRYNVCYSLKTVVENYPLVNDATRIEQVAIYHQFDVGTDTQHWVLTNTEPSVSKCMESMFQASENHREKLESPATCFNTSLEVHFHAARTMATGWFRYISYLEEELQRIRSTGLKPIPWWQDEVSGRMAAEVKRLEDLHPFETTLVQAISALELNTDILGSLHLFYEQLLLYDNFTGSDKYESYAYNVGKFRFRLQELILNINMQLKRVKLVLQRASSDKLLTGQKVALAMKNKRQRVE
ncbi:hypothetical protein F5Y18DRAFT_367710 [Xylariaceae sp. FL1019]|nr:hypothetical protein F5Y18DRAFT_367710 [Xylariaceae sp. FL1019]